MKRLILNPTGALPPQLLFAFEIEIPLTYGYMRVCLQVGDREDSNVYIRMKQKAAEDVGFHFRHVHLPTNVSEAELLQTVRKLNNDSAVRNKQCCCYGRIV